MFSSIGSLLDRLQGLLSKGFLLAGVTPFVLFFFVNWGLLYAIFPQMYANWTAAVAPPEKEDLLYWIRIVLILFVGSILLWNLNPWLRQFWEGRYLPTSLKLLLKQEHSKRFNDLLSKKRNIAAILDQYRSNYEPYLKQLSNARIKGEGKPASTINPALEQQFEDLRKVYNSFEPVPFAQVEAVFNLLEPALESQPADKSDLDKIHVGYVQLYEDVLGYYEYQYDRILFDMRQRFPGEIGRIGPTTMANFAEVHRDYGLVRYGLDIELFWIHLLKIIRGDAEFLPMLEEAKTQLDISIAITSVFALTTVVWLPISLWAATILPFALIAVLGPITVFITYEIAIQSYRGFSEVVQSAIDLNRFKLLEYLHIPAPTNSTEEKETWRELSDNSPTLTYSNNKPTLVQTASADNPSFLSRVKKWFGFL